MLAFVRTLAATFAAAALALVVTSTTLEAASASSAEAVSAPESAPISSTAAPASLAAPSGLLFAKTPAWPLAQLNGPVSPDAPEMASVVWAATADRLHHKQAPSSVPLPPSHAIEFRCTGRYRYIEEAGPRYIHVQLTAIQGVCSGRAGGRPFRFEAPESREWTLEPQ